MITHDSLSSIEAFTSGTWRWEHRALEGKHIATLLVTDQRPVPCNDPVIFALREDWMGQQSPEREAAKRLIQASPMLYAALRTIASQSLGPDCTAEQAVAMMRKQASQVLAAVEGV